MPVELCLIVYALLWGSVGLPAGACWCNRRWKAGLSGDHRIDRPPGQVSSIPVMMSYRSCT